MQAYESIQALNYSTLGKIAVSPLLLKWRQDHPEPDKPAFEIGRLIHVATLEPERFETDYIVEPDFGPQYTKKGELATNPKQTAGYKAAYLEWFSSIPAHVLTVAPEDRELALRCADAIRKHRVAGPLLKGGKAEQVITWTDGETGIPCKARLDLAANFVLDVKSTRQQTVRGFEYDAGKYLYDGKMAFYEDGAVAAGRVPKQNDGPYVIMVQNCEPWDVGAFHVPLAVLEVAREFNRGLIRKYQACVAADYFPGIAPDLLELNVYRRQEELSEESW